MKKLKKLKKLSLQKQSVSKLDNLAMDKVKGGVDDDHSYGGNSCTTDGPIIIILTGLPSILYKYN